MKLTTAPTRTKVFIYLVFTPDTKEETQFLNTLAKEYQIPDVLSDATGDVMEMRFIVEKNSKKSRIINNRGEK